MIQRKYFLLICGIITSIIAFAILDSNAEYLCGDANSDGTLNVSDAVYIINYVFIPGSPAPDSNCCESDCPRTVVDYDGNTYFTVKIGDQCWMAQNLKVTHYSNGDPIPIVTDGTEWGGLSTGAYCEYNNDSSLVPIYGRLYNWYAVDDSRNIAPEGWHVPSDAELKQLEMYLGMSQGEADAIDWRGTDEGGKLKEAGTTHWQNPNIGATNESAFTALPGGYRHYDGYFISMGITAHFWSFTESGSYYAWVRSLDHPYSQVNRHFADKRYGFSVRCVRD